MNDDQPDMIGELTIKEFIQGCSEAGENFEDYFYMTADGLAKDTKTYPGRKTTINWDNGYYMKATTGKLIWVIGCGLVKWGTAPKKISEK